MESPTPTLTLEDLFQLPPKAQLALSARAVWRIFPQIAWEAPKPPDAVTDSQRLTTGLVAADLIASGHHQLGGGLEALDDLLEYTINLGSPSSHASVTTQGLLAASLWALVEGRVSDRDMSTQVAEILQSLSSLGPGEAADATSLDFQWLAEWAGQKSSQDGIVAPDFFNRPLWEHSGGQYPPTSWSSVIEEWEKQVEQTGQKWLPRIYNALLEGKGPDWKQYEEAVFELRGYLNLREKLQNERDEQPGAPSTSEESDLLKGGTVTAAADTPALEDRLGRAPLVRTLADMLSSPDQPLPMTIALLGDWGSGKSSVIAQLRARLEELAQRPGRTRYLVADFNAWAYEQTDNVQAGLAQEVVRGLTRGLSGWERLVLAVRNASSQHGWGFYRTIIALFGTLLLVYLGLDNVDKMKDFSAMSQSLLGTGGAALLVYSLVRSWQQLRRFMEHPLAEKLSTYLQLPNYGEHLGQVPVIKEEIRSLCSARLGPNERLLVVVDDLDRCQPTCITETLDAIRLVMDLERAVVIVAIDDRIAFRAVAEHYRRLEDGHRSKEEIARDYLGKIIQLPVNLYEPWHWEVTRFIRDRLFIVEEGAEEPEPKAITSPLETPAAAAELTDAARALVKQNGLDPSRIVGTGRDGRILKSDVQAFLKGPQPSDDDMKEMGTLIDRPDETEPPPLADETREPPTPTDAAEEIEGPMQDTLFERELFADLARDMRFHNPRQLIRLRNSYRLLKGYRHNRKGGELSRGLVDSLMHGLFWYEHLYRQRRDQRQRAELIVWEWGRHTEWVERAERQKGNPPAVNMARRLAARLPQESWEREYHRLLRTVELVVLPNAQMGLLLSRAQVDRVLAGMTTDGTPSIDPWGSSGTDR